MNVRSLRWWTLALILGGIALWIGWPRAPQMPGIFVADLPVSCRQVLLVLAPEARAVQARMWMMERDDRGEWQAVSRAIPVTLGHQGLAWGLGEHRADPPAGFRVKMEGDKCSPAGVFRLPFAFGTAPSAPDIRVAYTPLSPTIIGVDDPKSRFYNQIVDHAKVERDWASNEAMIRHDRLYEWGAFIAHNPAGVPGRGSCIFLHLWPGPGKGTAGCTAMEGAQVQRVLRWLDPSAEPRLVQGLTGW
jgi:L,D-peptidoglycan transpeptidase YkuD (ErfK/YbiS/YcfS/YnhG family)